MESADERPRTRSRICISRNIQQERTHNHIHLSREGSRGCSLLLRRITIATYSKNYSYAAAARHVDCSIHTIWRWDERIMPYWMDGGSQWVSITGTDQLLLSIDLFVYQEATADQLCGFIHANGEEIYEMQQISDLCNQLEVSRKRGSKEAYDMFSVQSIIQIEWFVTLSPPLGVYGIIYHQLIDVDETVSYL